MTLTKTTCPYCGVGCGILAGTDGTIKGDPDHLANYGRLCSKGSALGETLDLEGRLLAPQIGDRCASWDEALDLVASKFSDAIKQHGPDSVAFYVSGQLLTEDYYVANKLMKGYIGSANIDTNSRLCMASSVVGHKRAFGTDTVPGCYEDLDDADLIVLVGSNLAWCHPVLYQRVMAAKQARPNLKIVNIDPRITASSDSADMHLKIRSDGDIAVFNGLLVHVVDDGHVNADYVSAHVNGFDDSVAAARKTQPTDSGISQAELDAFYALWAGTEKTVTIYSQGVNQSTCGSDKVNAIINCHLATGRIGRRGMGPFSVTGQPNAMGGREVGGLANMLANHLDIENPEHRNAVQSAWNSPTICTTQGLKAVDLFESCANGKIKALWVMSTNPAVSLPDAGRVADAIKAVPFTVVSDIMARTDTGDLADVLLPASGWGEKNGTVTNSERRVSRQRAFLKAPENTRPDWKIICDVATRMGWGDGFAFDTPADVFTEYAQTTAIAQQFGKDLDMTGLADLTPAEYETLAPVQWPIVDGQSRDRFFADGGFFHTDGKAKMLPIAAPVQSVQRFTLNTGRIRDQWHTMTRTGKTARLSAHLAEPFLEVHPTDAADLGLQSADIAELSTSGNNVLARVLVTDRTAAGTVFAPMHWTRQHATDVINSSVQVGGDPFSGQPALKHGAVDVKKAQLAWYGFAVSRSKSDPVFPYHATVRTQTGWQAEVAGYKTPSNWVATGRSLIGMDDCDIADVSDTQMGLTRLCFNRNGQIEGLFFASRDPVVVARSYAVTLIGQDVSALSALAGHAAGDMPDPGPTVCACFSVGMNTLSDAIADGANSVDALGEVTSAGTNCGSCKPELARLIDQFQLPVAAE